MKRPSALPLCFVNVVDAVRKSLPSRLPVSMGMYRSSYKRDYRWGEDYKPPSKEDMKKLQIADAQLKAKEFAVPRTEQGMTYSNGLIGERRVIPAPSTRPSSRADDAESYQPKYYPATELAATQAEKSERPRALAEPQNELSHCQRLPAAAQTAGTAGMLLHHQKMGPGWVTYQQFKRGMYQATRREAEQNRSMFLRSSVLADGERFDLDWRSTYNTDFQHRPGARGGYCRGKKRLSHIFPEEHLYRNRWVSEYDDNYNIYLRKLNWASHTSGVGLHSGLPSGKGIVMDTAQ